MEIFNYATQTREEIYQNLSTSEHGLSQQEAEERLKKYGLNEIQQNHFSWFSLIVRQIKSPFIYLLFVATVISYFLGNFLEGSMILFFVAINTLLGFYQEYKAEQTAYLLKQYIIGQTKVIRDNQQQIIKNTYLVPGDIIILEPGDIISADVRLIKSDNLMVDESIITGESVPVTKTKDILRNPIQELFEAKNLGITGTTVVSGKGIGIIIATGSTTSMGHIAHLTTTTIKESGFSKEMNKFSKFILALVVVTLLVILLLNIIIKGHQAQIGQLLIFAIALAVTITPELLPLVITFCLSRGAMHLAHKKVIVKRLSSIEDLGSIDILCTDKTGTLTENKLTLDTIYAPDIKKTLFYANLASSALPENENYNNSLNSFDIALWQALSPEEKQELKSYNKLYELPFDPMRLRSSVIVQTPENKFLLTVRGAFEYIIDHCQKLSDQDLNNINSWLQQQGFEGKRVLAVAHKVFDQSEQLEKIATEEKDIVLDGFISFVDPVKKDAPSALAKAKKLGLIVKVLTGDSREVAGFVANNIGLISDINQVITGSQFDELSEEQQQKKVLDCDVFARVSPEQKFHIIKLLQERGKVGYLGDGINDAPALKVADVALVVQGASDIARDAADIILLQKSLAVIINGIYEGRVVFANTVKYIKTILSSNFGNFYSVAISSLFIPFLPMLPLQILLVNLLSDFPMLAISSDTVSLHELRKPKGYNIKDILIFATLLGLVSSLFDAIFFILFYKKLPAVLQTNWFIESILSELVLVYSVRARYLFFKTTKPSNTLMLLSIISAIITIVIPYTFVGHHLFKFISPTIQHLAIVMILIVFYFITTDIVKLLYNKLNNTD